MADIKPTPDVDAVSRFHKVYDNLPLEERKQVVLVLGEEPISWEVARNQIIHGADKAKAILDKLVELRLV